MTSWAPVPPETYRCSGGTVSYRPPTRTAARTTIPCTAALAAPLLRQYGFVPPPPPGAYDDDDDDDDDDDGGSGGDGGGDYDAQLFCRCMKIVAK